MCELEQEVTEKDQRVEHLIQELETKHLEVEAKETAIQTLHQDLNRVRTINKKKYTPILFYY